MSQVQVQVEEVRVFTVTLPGQDQPIQLRLGADIAQDLFNELAFYFTVYGGSIWDKPSPEGDTPVEPKQIITRSGITYLNDEGEEIGFAPV